MKDAFGEDLVVGNLYYCYKLHSTAEPILIQFLYFKDAYLYYYMRGVYKSTPNKKQSYNLRFVPLDQEKTKEYLKK